MGEKDEKKKRERINRENMIISKIKIKLIFMIFYENNNNDFMINYKMFYC